MRKIILTSLLSLSILFPLSSTNADVIFTDMKTGKPIQDSITAEVMAARQLAKEPVKEEPSMFAYLIIVTTMSISGGIALYLVKKTDKVKNEIK